MDSGLIIGIIIACIGSSGLWQLLSNVISTKSSRKSTEQRALRALLRDRIFQAYRYHDGRGYLPLDERENIEDLFVQYFDLGGNGVVKDLHEKILKLPTEKT